MIRLEGITKVYRTRKGRRVVLDSIDLQVEKGQHIGIMGRNGSGKSTLIRLIGDAEAPTSGRIQRNMSVSWPLAFGGAFQPFLTGLDNLKFVCRIYGVDYREVLGFVEDFADLGSYFREPVLHYSVGMRARLSFALSMAIEFDCFLIDEVIAAGDSRFHKKCHAELFEKRRDRARIVVSHDPHTIRMTCDTALVLVNGKLESYSTTDEAVARYEATN